MSKLCNNGSDLKEAECINRIVLYWHPDDDEVYFEPFFTLVDTYGIKVLEATFMHSKRDSEGRPGIEFVVKGTDKNALMLAKACLYDLSMQQFIPKFYS